MNRRSFLKSSLFSFGMAFIPLKLAIEFGQIKKQELRQYFYSGYGSTNTKIRKFDASYDDSLKIFGLLPKDILTLKYKYIAQTGDIDLKDLHK